MQRGLRMNGWGEGNVKFYMLGNPAVWWIGSGSVLGILLLLGIVLLCRRRGIKVGPLLSLDRALWAPTADVLAPRAEDEDEEEAQQAFLFRTAMATGAWAASYLPFVLLGRVLYLHHYYPALIFSTLNTGILYDLLIGGILAARRRGPARHLDDLGRRRTLASLLGAAALLLLLIGPLFILFAPLAYGITGRAEDALAGLRWIKNWNFY